MIVSAGIVLEACLGLFIDVSLVQVPNSILLRDHVNRIRRQMPLVKMPKQSAQQ